jgi:hypothetical protein
MRQSSYLTTFIVLLAMNRAAQPQPPEPPRTPADYPDGVSAILGATNEENGLHQFDWDPQHRSRVVTLGGRECRATDKAREQFYLDFDVDDAYLFNVNRPVRVTVEYFDAGTGVFRLKYDSTDPGGTDQGRSKLTEPVVKTDSQTWKKFTFHLPDARFANESNGADLVLSCEGWMRGQTDLYVATVQVIQGGLQVTVEPGVAAADGESTCAVIARVFGPQGPGADGTPVHFETDLGSLSHEATTQNGEARTLFTAGSEPGEATVTVRAGEDVRQVALPLLPGRGRIVRRTLILDRFAEVKGWWFMQNLSSQTLQPAPEQLREGHPSSALTYEFYQPDQRGQFVALGQSLLLPGRPSNLGLWVYQDGSHNSLCFDLQDATGQVHEYLLGNLTTTGWHWMAQDLGPAFGYYGGANDGRLHLPLRFRRLVLRSYFAAEDRKFQGTVYLQDLTVVADVPESEKLLLDVTMDRPNDGFPFPAGEPIPFHVNLANLTEDMLPTTLRWAAVDEPGETLAEGQQDMEIPAQSRVPMDLPVDLPKPGTYQVSFRAEAADAVAKQDFSVASQPFADGEIVLCAFNDPGTFQLAGPAAADCTLTVVDDPEGQAQKCARLTYDFQQEENVFIHLNTPREIQVETFQLAVRGDGSGNFLRLRLVDASGETFQYVLSRGDFTDWQTVTQNAGEVENRWGGDGNGRLNYPLQAAFLVLTRRVGPQPGAVSGTLFLRDLMVGGKIVAPVQVQAEPADDGFTVQVSNPSEATQRFFLRYAVFNDRQEKVTEGSLGEETMTLEPEALLETPLRLEGLPAGAYAITVWATTEEGKRVIKRIHYEVPEQ